MKDMETIIKTVERIDRKVDSMQSALIVEYLRPAEAALYLQVSEAYLAKLRCQGGGPEFHTLGRRAVRYKRSSIDEWAAEYARKHTSEPNSSCTFCTSHVRANEPQKTQIRNKRNGI